MQIFNKWRYILVLLIKFLKNVEFFIPQRSVQDLGGIILVILQILDADNGQRLESSTGRIATRDIVQFVPMREVHGEFILILLYYIICWRTFLVLSFFLPSGMDRY